MAYWTYVFGPWQIEADWPHPKLSHVRSYCMQGHVDL